MRDNVTLWCRTCTCCAAKARPKKPPQATMGTVRVGSPFECIKVATLQKIIATTAERCPLDWDIMTPYAVLAYRATKHSSTGLTPNMMLFGWVITEPVDLVAGLLSDPENTTTPPSYVIQLQDKLALCHQLAREALGKSVARAKRQYDKIKKLKKRKVGMQYGFWSKAPREQRIKCGNSYLPTRVCTSSWVYWTT